MTIKERYDEILRARQACEVPLKTTAEQLRQLSGECAAVGHVPDGVEAQPGFQHCANCGASLPQ